MSSITQAAQELLAEDGGFYRIRDRYRTTQQIRDVAERMLALESALERLASAKGFEGAGMVDGDSFAERELRARMRFASEALS